MVNDVPRSRGRLRLPPIGCDWKGMKHQINKSPREAAIAEAVEVRTHFHLVGGI